MDSQVYTVNPKKSDFSSFTCVTTELTNNTFLPFGNDNGHIQTAKDHFKFGDKYNETYVGQVHPEGKTIDHWRTCVYEEESNVTYTLDSYFDADQQGPTLPVRVHINGTAPVHSNVTGDPERQWFHHVYMYLNVDIGPRDLEVFYPPVGVICPGRVNDKDVPSIPVNFALNVEVVVPNEKKIYYSKEFYHHEAKIVAYEMLPRKGKIDQPIRAVHDYNTGIAYRISPTGTCHMNPIPVGAEDAVSRDDEHVAMRTPASLFALHDPDVNWVYEGMTITRDAFIHAWQSLRIHWKPAQHRGDKNILVNSTWMYYFLDDDWSIDGGSVHKDKTALPLRLEIMWIAHKRHTGEVKDRGKEIHNFYQPFEGPVEHHYFDVSDCYTHTNESLPLAFNLEGKDTYSKYVANNTRHFKSGVIQSLADSIGVSIIRIAHLKVVDGYKDLATVFFTLLDKPQIEGDAINATDPGPELDTSYSLLQELINGKDGSMLILEFIYHNKVTKVNAASSTLREETEPLIQTKQVGLTTGVASGIAIGTFVLGAAIAAVGACVVFKYKTREVPYSVQE
ncbi:uncharacterized protein [Amphiura filiformis]|uniref:uncharacterized protein n=1 Tax=Amphiura filiformis TaxID=82378 RepID=UPI003B2263C0